MVYQEIVGEIKNLPLNEQLSLMETLARLINRRTAQRSAPANSLKRIRGMLKPAADESIPSGAELSDDYADYLIRKYS